MDITYFEHTVRPRQGAEWTVVRSSGPEAPKWYAEVSQTEKVTLHLSVGTPVAVRAFGATRPGTVVKLGRTKATVDFQQNRDGARGQRSFGSYEITPTVGTPHDRVVLDTSSSASRQHFVDTGEYLPVGEADRY